MQVRSEVRGFADSWMWSCPNPQPNTGGIKSYPNVSKWVGTPINSLHSVTSGYNVSVPSGGAFETAYDVWDSANSNEIMLWLNQTGPIGPIGFYVTTVGLGGYTWNVYKGCNGSNNVYSFLNTGGSTFTRAGPTPPTLGDQGPPCRVRRLPEATAVLARRPRGRAVGPPFRGR